MSDEQQPFAWLYGRANFRLTRNFDSSLSETPLYTHPPAVSADELVDMVARAIGTHIMPGSPWEANFRAELAACKGAA